MPRNRIFSAAIVATVLTVGASLAFREGAFYQHAAGVGSMTTKSAARSSADDSVTQRDRAKGNGRQTDAWRKGRMEAFLKEHGRTGANLIAAILICENPVWREELKQLTNDPVAMEFLAIREAGMPAYPQHLLRLEPENAHAILLKARTMGSYDNEADPQSVRDLILLAGTKTKYIRHSEEVEVAVRSSRQFLGESLREVWASVPETYRLLDFSDRLADLHPSQYARRTLTDEDLGMDGKAQMVQAVKNIMRGYERAGDHQASLRWSEVLADTPYDTGDIQQQRDQIRALAAVLDQRFLAALEVATPKQILSMEVRNIRNSSVATRMTLLNEVDPEALDRYISERIEPQQNDRYASPVK